MANNLFLEKNIISLSLAIVPKIIMLYYLQGLRKMKVSVEKFQILHCGCELKYSCTQLEPLEPNFPDLALWL